MVQGDRPCHGQVSRIPLRARLPRARPRGSRNPFMVLRARTRRGSVTLHAPGRLAFKQEQNEERARARGTRMRLFRERLPVISAGRVLASALRVEKRQVRYVTRRGARTVYVVTADVHIYPGASE